MKLIVGLGNPGEKYAKTRHNLGFIVLDRFLQDCKSARRTKWEEKAKFKSLLVECSMSSKFGDDEKLLLVKPQTHMNASGIAVEKIASFYKIEPFDIWVVHDELDLPIGSMKIRKGGSSAGHKGIESLIEQLGTEMFWRFRIGIGVKRDHSEVGGHVIKNADEFVLGSFAHGELGKVREIIKRASHAISCATEDSIEAAMNRFNTK